MVLEQKTQARCADALREKGGGRGSCLDTEDTSHGKGRRQADDERVKMPISWQGNLVSIGRFERSPCHAFICRLHSHLPIQFWVGSDLFRIYSHETGKPIKTAVRRVSCQQWFSAGSGGTLLGSPHLPGPSGLGLSPQVCPGLKQNWKFCHTWNFS